MRVFEWFEGTGLAIWVGESLWGYPLMLSLHVIGLAIVVGISWMQNFRVLGWVGEAQFASLARLSTLARIGLAINALSGLALFSSQATVFVDSVPFLTKISAIAIGVGVGLPLQRTLRQCGADWDSGASRPESRVRFVAMLSTVCWVVAIIAGRLIAYL